MPKIIDIIHRYNLEYKTISGTDERVFICPSCGKDEHFYFNINKGLGICHRCLWECNSIIFLMAMLGIDSIAARRLLKGRQDTSTQGLMGRVAKLFVEDKLIEDELEYYEVYFKNPLPEGLTPVSKKHFPKIFKERNVSLEQAIKSGAMFCNVHGDYFNRIIFPIKSFKNETFTAVTALSKEKVKIVQKKAKLAGRKYRKSLFPKGSFISEVLHNYDNVKKEREIVVVEGIWDYLALERISIPSVPLLGYNLSDWQALLLSKTKADSIYLMLDGSTKKKILKKNFKKLFDVCFDKKIKFCILEGGKDPDESSEKEIEKAISESRSILL